MKYSVPLIPLMEKKSQKINVICNKIVRSHEYHCGCKKKNVCTSTPLQKNISGDKILDSCAGLCLKGLCSLSFAAYE